MNHNQLELHLNNPRILNNYIDNIEIDNDFVDLICKKKYNQVIEIIINKVQICKWDIIFKFISYGVKYDNIEIIKSIARADISKSNVNFNFITAMFACENKAYNVMKYLLNLEFDRRLEINKCIEIAINNNDEYMVYILLDQKKYVYSLNILLRNCLIMQNDKLFKCIMRELINELNILDGNLTYGFLIDIINKRNLRMLMFLMDIKKNLQFKFNTHIREIENLVAHCIKNKEYKMAKIIIENFNLDHEYVLDILISSNRKMICEEKMQKIIHSLLRL